jgi:hypothetical protein
MNPLRSAGKAKGSVIVMAVRHLFAPKISAASSRSDEINSQTLAIIANTNGKLYSAITKINPGMEKILNSALSAPVMAR